MSGNKPFRMKFEMSTIKHLGLQMYSTLPPVIGELVANAWDANATTVTISIPQTPLDAKSRIIIEDDGLGMPDSDIRYKYLIVGRDRRDAEHRDRTPKPFDRRIMRRKGIGKSGEEFLRTMADCTAMGKRGASVVTRPTSPGGSEPRRWRGGSSSSHTGRRHVGVATRSALSAVWHRLPDRWVEFGRGALPR